MQQYMKQFKMIKIILLLLISFTAQAASIYAPDGKYLGEYSENRFDRNSISNHYGRYGSRYSQDSINNPYSKYGNRNSWQSPYNPYVISTPQQQRRWQHD
jgi:hypothetical protein